MDYVSYGANVYEELPGSRIAIVYKDMDELRSSERIARSNGFRTVMVDERNGYCILMKDKHGEIVIVGFVPSCTCSWNRVTEFWYDDSIQKEEINTLIDNVSTNVTYTPRCIQFSGVKATYDRMFTINEPDEELDAFIDELARKCK